MADVICPCGASFEGLHGNRRHCTDCRPVRKRQYIAKPPKPPKPPETYTCQIPDCSVEFTAKVPAKFCSNRCRKRNQYLPGGSYWKNPITCAACGVETTRWPKSVQGKTRCPECIADARNNFSEHGTRKMYREFGCRCDECRDFINASCREYAKQHREQTGESLYRNYRNPKLRKQAASRRRARLADAFIEDVDHDRVFESDGYVCYGCGRKCIKGAPNNHPLQPTIDHVIPLSKGGTHEYANVRTMCRQCNVGKGAKLLVG